MTASYMTGMSDATAAVNNATSAVTARLLQKAGVGSPVPMTADAGVLSLLGEPMPCGGGGGAPVSLQCVSWRQTANCDATGHHLEPKNDKPCSVPIVSGQSGYCECSGGIKRSMVGCDGHSSPFTCDDVCHELTPNTNRCFGIPPPASFNTTAVVLHNTLGWDVSRTIRLVSNRSDLIVLDGNGTLVPSQLNPLSSFDPYSASTRPSDDMHFFPEMSNALDFSSPTYAKGFALYFVANIPAASLATFFLTIDATRAVQGQKKSLTEAQGVMENSALRLQFDAQSGLLTTVQNKRSATNATVKQQLWQYKSGGGDGAYIFRPAERRQSRALQEKQCALTGDWTYHYSGGSPGDPGDVYEIVESAQGGNFTARVLSSGKAAPGWTTASGTDVDSHISIRFDNGVLDSGTVDASCSHIRWKDGTQWARKGAGPAGPPPPPPAPASRSLSGLWDYTNGAGQRDVYRITEDGSSEEFTVAIVSGHEQWHTATGSVTGPLKQQVTIKFDSGITDTGSISLDYNTIRWEDKSVWARSGTVPPAPPGPPPPTPGPGPSGVDQAPVSTQPPTSILYTVRSPALFFSSVLPHTTLTRLLGILGNMAALARARSWMSCSRLSRQTASTARLTGCSKAQVHCPPPPPLPP